MGADAQTDVVSEIARLRLSLGRAATATETSLAAHPPLHEDDDPRSPLAQHDELCRQLAALRERVASAEYRHEDPRGVRAELATLLFFAETLQADAETWRSALEHEIKEHRRRRRAARRERERLAAEREKLLRRRDSLQWTILQTAGRMAQERGECRKTLPVFTLEKGLTVCSVSVSCPRRGIRFPKQWLVTLDGSDGVLVRRE
jgi:hypothetical protein